MLKVRVKTRQLRRKFFSRPSSLCRIIRNLLRLFTSNDGVLAEAQHIAEFLAANHLIDAAWRTADKLSRVLGRDVIRETHHCFTAYLAHILLDCVKRVKRTRLEWVVEDPPARTQPIEPRFFKLFRFRRLCRLENSRRIARFQRACHRFLSCGRHKLNEVGSLAQFAATNLRNAPQSTTKIRDKGPSETWTAGKS